MLFSNILAPTLFFHLTSTVLANPVGVDTRDIEVDGDIDGKVITIEPALIDFDDLDERDFLDEESQGLEKRATLSSDQSGALKLHNDARAKRKIVALKWDDTLAANALAYAKSMAKSGVFAHSTSSQRPGQGENLAYQWSTAPIKNPISQGVTRWLAEEKYYHNEPIPQGEFEKYGHYTQCMWKNTLRVGLATAYNGKGAWYTVARYAPAGNVGGQRPY